MKKQSIKLFAIITTASVLLLACGKNKCAECHYDYGTQEVEIGEKCGDSLKAVEADGIVVNDTLYEVHCHEH
jgi:hypothetical protein